MSRILIIEDSADINALLAETLTAEGFETQSAFEGVSNASVDWAPPWAGERQGPS